ncbi:MAG: AsmA family protein, partial [Elusimicrobiaceae bacterium]|nr:AsmA family protein [Elusimicrobiaceae bacterium]
MRVNCRKFLKIAGYIFIGLCILLVLAELSLRFILPSESVKAKTLAYLSQTVGADIKTSKISASLFGIKLNNVSVDLEGKTLFNCKNLQIGLNPFRLLIGQFYISKIIIYEPSLNVTRNQDGTFNFESLMAGEEKQQTSPSAEKLTVPFDIRIKNLTVNKGQISFTDLKENIKANLQNLNFNLHKFSFYKPFSFKLSFDPYFEQNNIVFDGAHFALNGAANLNKFDLPGAYLNLKNLLLEYKETSLEAQAQISNFENLGGTVSAELKDLSDGTLSAFTETLPFRIPLVTSDISFEYFVKNSKANIKNLVVKIADTELNLKANLDLNKNEISGGKITFKSVLDSFKSFSPLLEELQPAGKINADFDFAWPLALAGNLTLADIGLITDKAGTLENLNTTVNVKSIDEINIETLSGILNKNPFNMQASYKKQEKFADVFLDFKADKLYVFDTSKKDAKEAEKPAIKEETPQAMTQETPQTNDNGFSFVPVNVNANVDIKKLDIPFIKGNNLVFTANARNITTQLDKVHGTFNLNIEKGQIKDIYTISNANSVTKVMFMSLGIVSKVVNTLNVLDLLNGMGKVLSGNKEEEEELPVHQEINGKMDFDSFKTNIDFNEGLATMKKCAFVSSLFSFRVQGNINFDNRKIKLNVDSAPG